MVKVVIYVSTITKWLFLGFYDPLLPWALNRVLGTLRVLVPNEDVTRYRKEGALVIVVDSKQVETIRTTMRIVHVWLVDSVQKVDL